jgi:hypothetical protein
VPAKWPSLWQVASSPGDRSFVVSQGGEGFDLFSQMSLLAMEARRNQNPAPLNPKGPATRKG